MKNDENFKIPPLFVFCRFLKHFFADTWGYSLNSWNNREMKTYHRAFSIFHQMRKEMKMFISKLNSNSFERCSVFWTRMSLNLFDFSRKINFLQKSAIVNFPQEKTFFSGPHKPGIVWIIKFQRRKYSLFLYANREKCRSSRFCVIKAAGMQNRPRRNYFDCRTFFKINICRTYFSFPDKRSLHLLFKRILYLNGRTKDSITGLAIAEKIF